MPAETASKAALLMHREELQLVTQGKAVLEQQREQLAHTMLELIREIEAQQQRFELLINNARHSIRGAILRHGHQGLSGFRMDNQLTPPQWQQSNRLGAVWLEDDSASRITEPPEPKGGWEISLELEQAAIGFHRLVEVGADLAKLQNNLQRMTRLFKRTQQRSNALENIILPELRLRIRELENALDEMEREELVRSRLAKQRRERKVS